MKKESTKSNSLESKKINEQVKSDIKNCSKRIAELIKNKRKNLRITMMSLYEKSGVAASTINDIEKSKYLPHFDVILKLGYALGIPYVSILEALAEVNMFSRDVELQHQLVIQNSLDVLGYTREEIREILDFIRFKGKYEKLR